MIGRQNLMKFSIFAFVFVLPAVAVDWDVITPLDQYVQRDDGDDDVFDWYEIASYNYVGVTLYIVNMTSQRWQTDAFSTHSIWWHVVGIAIPDVISFPEAGIIMITSGSNSNTNPPDRNDLTGIGAAVIANDTGIITAYIMQIPNQPIRFHNDPDSRQRSEDSLIAWTWRTFIDSSEPSDPTVILRMPMTKAVKRAMDTVNEYAKWRAPETDVKKFVVSGASKRGWTTWSIAATDQRVVALAPLVFSLLNFDDRMGGGTLMNHFRNMDGAWSFALAPYYNENLTQEFFNEKSQRLYQVEDMYYYKERFTIPLLEMVSSGDEFFLCDDNHHWWDDIPANPKLLMMLPNAEHTMAPHYPQIYGTAVSFVMNIFENKPFPSVTWHMQETETGGFIHFMSDPPPVAIKAYVAVTLANDTRRDFRLAAGTPPDIAVHPVVWKQELDIIEVSPGSGEYMVEAQKVEDEWVGFFVEGTWEGYSIYRMIFTSQVNIIPNIYPRGPCSDTASCYGTLV